MELVARLEAGERAADLAAEAGVTAAAVSGWRRRLREEGALSLMTDSDIAARAPEPREAPSELEELRARCEELELRNAVSRDDRHTKKKTTGADLSALTARRGRRWLTGSGGASGCGRRWRRCPCRAARSTTRLAAASAPDPYAALRPLVRAAFEASGGAYGYRRVRAELARGAGAPQRARGAAGLDPARPVAVSEKVVRRIMPRRGCAPAPPRAARYSSTPARRAARRRPTCCWSTPARPARLLGRAPGEVLVTDITEFRLPRRPAEGVPLAGRRPVRRRRRRLLGGHLAVQGARGRDARRRRGRRGGGFTLHSDRGWHYRTPDWVRACGEAGVERSMSRKGHSPDNAALRGVLSAGSRSSSSTGGTGAGSPPSGSPPSSPSGSAGTGRGG